MTVEADAGPDAYPATRDYLPACCMAVTADLMSCLGAAYSTDVEPEQFGERVLEVSARAALYRWLSHLVVALPRTSPRVMAARSLTLEL